MANKYIPLWLNRLEDADMLEDDQLGRVFRAILVYANEREHAPAFQTKVETGVFKKFKGDIDRSADRYDACVENGRKGAQTRWEKSGIPKAIPKAIPEGIPKAIPEAIPEGIPESIGWLSETIPEDVPERIPNPQTSKHPNIQNLRNPQNLQNVQNSQNSQNIQNPQNPQNVQNPRNPQNALTRDARATPADCVGAQTDEMLACSAQTEECAALAAPKKQSAQEQRFGEFWLAYPKKVGKGAALSAWKKANVTEALFAKIMQAIATQKQCGQWSRDNGQFIPNPATWLNQGRWDDELAPPKREEECGNPFLDALERAKREEECGNPFLDALERVNGDEPV